MSDRTGLDAVTLAALECLDELGARSDQPYVKNATVVGRMYQTRDIPPLLAYEAVCISATEWLVPLRLIDFHGNHGSPDRFDEPASPRYTEARLSPVGAIALASERGEVPRLPIGLINGDFALGGTAPSFDPVAVAHALSLAADEATTDAELVAAAGPPVFVTGCAVECDLAALASGGATRLRSSAIVRVEHDRRGTRMVLSNFPLGVGADDAGQMLASRLDAARRGPLPDDYPELRDAIDLPIRDVRNESQNYSARLVCELLPGADFDRCRQHILDTWPVTTEMPVQLPAPLATIVRGFVDDPLAQGKAMRALLATPPLSPGGE